MQNENSPWHATRARFGFFLDRSGLTYNRDVPLQYTF